MTPAPTPPTPQQVQRYAQLMGSVMLFVVTHVLALVTMLLFLQPGLDSSLDLLARAAHVREHSTAWVIGWLPWQLSALSDLLVSITLLRYVRVLPGRPGHGAAWAALGFNVLAVVPEQYAELELVTTLVARVQTLEGDALRAYMGEASRLFMILTGTVANTFYTFMLLGWMLTLGGLRGALGLPMRILFVERVLLGLFLLAGLLTYLAFDSPPAHAARYFALSTAVNGLAFPGLILFSLFWAATLGDAHHLRFAHPAEATWALRWPGGSAGKGSALFAGLAQRLGSPGFRDVLRVLTRRWPYPTLRSQVHDVVYLNWMVPAERVRSLLPEGLVLDELDGRTPLSILTYRHGHFGPAFAGPLRRFMLSPLQSNWRVYLSPEPPTRPGQPALPQDAIAFISTCMDSTLYTLGSRLGSDGLPSHRLGAGSQHTRARVGDTDQVETLLVNEGGSAPDLRCRVSLGTQAPDSMPAEFAGLGTPEQALAYLVEQNRAVRAHRALGLISESHIDIPIPLSSVRAATVLELESAWLAPLIEGCTAWAFFVPSVPFASLGETLRRLPAET